MTGMKIADIVSATGGRLINGNSEDLVCDICTDSRIISEGMLFVALVGESFDGNSFAQKAIEAGACGCVVSDPDIAYKNTILVPDTTKALGDIAKYYRQGFNIPFVGITGSVGKTTTKDMIACVLSHKYNVLKTQGNFNNHIGLPLTILRLNDSHEIGVTEMGMSGFGEIDRLSEIAMPDTAVYTNIGLSHVEKLGSRENILKAKLEMLNHTAKDGFVILCGDDDMLCSIRNSIKHKHIYYGIENGECEVRAEKLSGGDNCTSFEIHYGDDVYNATIPVLGEHNVKNALAAFCVGIKHGISPGGIIEALSGFEPGKMRQNIININGITVINDCYNASPSSVEAGLKTLNQINNSGRKIAVLGDMLEMGKLSEDAHKMVGKTAARLGVDFIVTVGRDSVNIADGAVSAGFNRDNTSSFKTNAEACEFLDTLIQEGDAVLVKASRGMKLEEIVDHIIEF